MNERLSGKIAVITGAGSGIGRATSLRFVQEGAAVLGVDRDPAGLEQTALLADNAPGRMATLVGDVTHAGAPEDIMAACPQRLGAADILINNAGIGAAKPVHETEDDELDRFNDVNFRSVFRLSRALVRELIARNTGGCIVNLSSIFGLRGFPGSSIYSANKAALIGLTQNMAADYGPNGIRVNAIAPGLIETPLTVGRIAANPWFDDALKGSTPLGRLGQPEDIAAAIAFLCSDDASFITGQVLAVDGGWSTTKFRPPPDLV
jgi:3-oxoacyl-[acyl-carrier protein] reductase